MKRNANILLQGLLLFNMFTEKPPASKQRVDGGGS
jgi:hypothetical protein